jgi:hypothetical protein
MQGTVKLSISASYNIISRRESFGAQKVLLVTVIICGTLLRKMPDPKEAELLRNFGYYIKINLPI